MIDIRRLFTRCKSDTVLFATSFNPQMIVSAERNVRDFVKESSDKFTVVFEKRKTF